MRSENLKRKKTQRTSFLLLLAAVSSFLIADANNATLTAEQPTDYTKLSTRRRKYILMNMMSQIRHTNPLSYIFSPLTLTTTTDSIVSSTLIFLER